MRHFDPAAINTHGGSDGEGFAVDPRVDENEHIQC